MNPNDLDATDSIENQGNSLTRPFKTIQRALVEASRFSYQKGLDNDRFGKTTVLIYPGEHVVDNRPGFIPDGSDNFRLRNGTTSDNFPPFDLTSNFDLDSPNNELYKLNSIHGGVILPRGTSLVGLDLRKTKIRPKYVPDPENDNIERSCLFRVTGGCYLWQFSMFDGDPNGKVYKDYTTNEHVPNFSHHKLSCFEYADGVNNVKINDEFITNYTTDRTDLTMYYEKVGLAYGQSSGRAIEPDYPSTSIDIQAKIDEYRIVGSTGASVGITSIFAGDGTTTSTTITVTLESAISGLDVDTPFVVDGISAAGYDGKFVVSDRPSSTQVKYQVQNSPTTPNPSATGSTLTLSSDTVTSASPYIFNCSLRSVYGMCGMIADGKKATGFKSMVVAQFTGIGLQKDNNAFVRFNTDDIPSGNYDTSLTVDNLSTNSKAVYKPAYRNFHVKVTNEAVIQAVSVFAIGYAQHFLTENGGDISLTNSNSNFGAVGLEADGFKPAAFIKDDKGYITSIVPPKKNFNKDENVNWESIDVQKTIGVSTDTQLFIRGYNVKDTVPIKTASGYEVGNKQNDKIFCSLNNTVYGADILMPGPNSNPDTWGNGKKEVFVGSNSGINSITANVITLEDTHNFNSGEKIRFYSDTGSLPDGIVNDKDYFVISAGVQADQIKLATTYNNAIAGSNITTLNNLGGKLRVVSTVAGKEPGEPGHPIQYTDGSGWYINVGAGNSLRQAIVTNQATTAVVTQNTFVVRKPDTRKDLEKIYRLRYVVPDNATVASPPSNGFTLQESATSLDDTYYKNNNTDLTSVSDLRTNNTITNATWNSSGNVGVITAQSSHRLGVGNQVELSRIKSTENVNGTDNSGFNGMFEVLTITDSKTFTVGLNTNPGSISTISLNTPYTFYDQGIVGSGRTFAPYFTKRNLGPSFQIFNNEIVQEFSKGVQDGIYDLTVLGYLTQPDVSPFSTTTNYFPQDINNLRPAIDADNYHDDPVATKSYALRDKIGHVVSNDPKNSITKEMVHAFVEKTNIGVGITATSHSSGTLTLDTVIDHNFDGIKAVTNITGGTGYGTSSGNAEFYYNIPLTGGSGNGQGATVDVTVAAAGTITAAAINYPGSGYNVNDILTITGVPFRPSGSTSACTIKVSEISNNQGDVIQVVGVGSTGYNGVYRITNVENNRKVSYNGTLAGGSGVGGFVYHVGIATAVNNIVHDKLSGIATVTLASDIGLRRGDHITISGASQVVYNGTHTVTDRVGYGSSMMVNIGITSIQPSYSGSGIAHGAGIGDRGFNQNIPIYGGQTTTLNNDITLTATTINLKDRSMLRRGDYLQIEDEIVRITDKNITKVLRGTLGTNAAAHLRNVAAVKIKVLPVEGRRNSLIRASGHTFEYVGFGPGNYSTAMPQVQDRILDDKEQLLAQASQTRGGLVVYTAMNDKGEFYVGRKKIDALTGEEVSTIDEFDTTSVSAPNTQTATNATFDNLTVNQNLYSNGNDSVVDLKFRGNRGGSVQNKEVFVGISQNVPANTDTNNNILFNTDFARGGYIGWVQTTESGNEKWQRWGPISVEAGTEHYAFDKLAIGQTSVTTGQAFSVIGQASIYSLAVSDLTAGRVVIVGTGGELQDSSSLTFSGATVTANTLGVTNNTSVGADLTVGRHAKVTGITTAEHFHSTDDVTIDDDLIVGGNIIANTGTITAANQTFVGVTTFSADMNVGTSQAVGVILTSPNGTKYRLVVADNGALSTNQI